MNVRKEKVEKCKLLIKTFFFINFNLKDFFINLQIFKIDNTSKYLDPITLQACSTVQGGLCCTRFSLVKKQ